MAQRFPTTKSLSFWRRVMAKNHKEDQEADRPKKAVASSFRHDFVLEGIGLHGCVLIDCVDKMVHDVLMHTYRPIVAYDKIEFGEGALRILKEVNAGGTSRWSEALSFEIIFSIFGAKLLNTEMQLSYDLPSKRTDYSVEIFGRVLGVSVTRAMKYHGEYEEIEAEEEFKKLSPKAVERHEMKKKDRRKPYDREDASRLLNRKLFAVLSSTEKVKTAPKWKQQILHIFCENLKTANIVRDTLDDRSCVDANLVDNTIVLLTVASRDPWIFYNPSSNPRALATTIQSE